MTKYLREYIAYVEEMMRKSNDSESLHALMNEHKDKIAFMQHERLVHFLVTMMFALILVILLTACLITDNIMLLVLVTIILVLLGAYIKHYYFLENTVQHMYRIYDDLLRRINSEKGGE